MHHLILFFVSCVLCCFLFYIVISDVAVFKVDVARSRPEADDKPLTIETLRAHPDILSQRAVTRSRHSAGCGLASTSMKSCFTPHARQRAGLACLPAARLPHMLKQASWLDHLHCPPVRLPGEVASSVTGASKAALNWLCANHRRHLRQQGVRCNGIAAA